MGTYDNASNQWLALVVNQTNDLAIQVLVINWSVRHAELWCDTAHDLLLSSVNIMVQMKEEEPVALLLEKGLGLWAKWLTDTLGWRIRVNNHTLADASVWQMLNELGWESRVVFAKNWKIASGDKLLCGSNSGERVGEGLEELLIGLVILLLLDLVLSGDLELLVRRAGCLGGISRGRVSRAEVDHAGGISLSGGSAQGDRSIVRGAGEWVGNSSGWANRSGGSWGGVLLGLLVGVVDKEGRVGALVVVEALLLVVVDTRLLFEMLAMTHYSNKGIVV